MLHRLPQMKGFIFDLDGTLMHSHLDFHYLRTATGCPDGEDILSYVDGLDYPAQLAAKQIIIDHEVADAKQAKWIDGALALVQHLSSVGMPIAIVTRNCQEAVAHKLTGKIAAFNPVLTREDAAAKPDPEALLKIAHGWHIAVDSLAYVGDYIYDVQAANRAGMLSCLYAPSQVPDYAEQADVVFQDFSQFKDYLN